MRKEYDHYSIRGVFDAWAMARRGSYIGPSRSRLMCPVPTGQARFASVFSGTLPGRANEQAGLASPAVTSGE
jgi:hypothetical protein